jgi:subfamily B ATP-binding cassette protein MsbA
MTRGRNLRRILKLLRPYRTKQAITFIVMIANVGLGLLLPLIIRYLIDEVIGGERPDLLLPLVLVALGVFAAAALFGVLTNYLFNLIGQNIVRDIRNSLFTHIMALPFGFFTGQGTGRIMSRVLSDVSTIGRVVSTIMLDFLMNSLMVVGYFSIMFYFHWKLTLLSFTTVPLYILLIRFFSTRLQRTSYAASAAHAEISSALQESLSGIKEVRAFNMEEGVVAGFYGKLSEFFLTRMRLAVLTGGSVHLGILISSAATLLVIWYGGNLVLRDIISLGTLIAMWSYLGQLFTPVKVLMAVNVRFQEASAAFSRIDEISRVRPSVREHPDPAALPEAKGRITFEHVTFSYGEGKAVLKDMSLDITAGERVAIVGRSGSGKTTMANLIMRFFDPDRGSVTLDGIDVSTLKISDLRKNVALVSQDTFLFNASIEENIRFGRAAARHKDVTRAAEMAGIQEFAASLEHGLKTVVGERGVSVSGGERQRIALARAILRNPAVLVLDEATSQLDSQAESRLRVTLEEVMRGRTSVMIAHRLSTISGAERILVLDEGQIAEEGTHKTLIAQRGVYYALYEEQARLQE